METKDYEASILQPKKVTITNTTNNEFDLQMYRVNLQLLIGGRSSKYPDGQEVDFIIESSEEYVYYASVIENLGDEWNIDNNHKISIAFEDAGGGSAVLIEKSVTANGVYNASDDQADGYSKVTVNVPAPVSTYNVKMKMITDDYPDRLADVSRWEMKSVVIPEGITQIEPSAFVGQTYLSEVVFPSTLTSINGYSFQGCNKLESVVIPSSVYSIDIYAFGWDYEYPDDGLRSITFESPSSLTIIESNAFDGQRYLPSIVIPASVSTIGEDCFRDCSALETITINKPEGSIEGAPWGAPETTQIIWNG